VTSDIIERLKNRADTWRRQSFSSSEYLMHYSGWDKQIDDEAAAELARLRARVAELEGESARLQKTLEAAATQFEFYEQQHMAKSPPDEAKAITNRSMAMMCRGAITLSQPERTDR
jgi:hypothetical protein